jgi:integrase
MTDTGRRRTRIVTGIHPVPKRLKLGKRWYIYAWRGGPRIAVQDGERPVITVTLVRAAEEARAELRGPPTDTVRWAIGLYKAHTAYTRLAASTKRDYDALLGNIDTEFGDCDITLFEDIRTRGEVDEWRGRWAHQPRTADKHIVMLNTLLNWAKREKGLLATNHVAEMGLWHSADKSDEVWEDRHWEAVEGIPPHIMRALKLASLTGLRLSDLVAMEWRHVFDKAIILVTEKRKGTAVIPIFGELRAFLDEIRPEKAEGPVLLNLRRKGWTKSGLESSWQKKQPEGFDRTIHDLRGTFVTWLAIKGLTDREIADIIGWTTQKIAAIRAVYVDRARVVVSLAERLSK